MDVPCEILQNILRFLKLREIAKIACTNRKFAIAANNTIEEKLERQDFTEALLFDDFVLFQYIFVMAEEFTIIKSKQIKEQFEPGYDLNCIITELLLSYTLENYLKSTDVIISLIEEIGSSTQYIEDLSIMLETLCEYDTTEDLRFIIYAIYNIGFSCGKVLVEIYRISPSTLCRLVNSEYVSIGELHRITLREPWNCLEIAELKKFPLQNFLMSSNGKFSNIALRFWDKIDWENSTKASVILLSRSCKKLEHCRNILETYNKIVHIEDW